MATSHITLRIPAALAKLLDRVAASRGVPKSQIVREAVAQYTAPVVSVPEPVHRVTGAALAAKWGSLSFLTRDEASEFGKEIKRARRELPVTSSRWE